MKAAVVDEYGPPDIVRIARIDRPSPGTGDVLVRVHATSVSAADARIRGARFPAGFSVPARMGFGIRRPRRRVLGGTFSGVVEEVGSAVTGVVPGDEVCGTIGLRMGTHAEYVSAPAKLCVPKPDDVSHDEAAGLLFGGLTALYFLRDRGKVTAGQSVLVNGASGAVGTMAVQLARHLGADVTAVCSDVNTALVHDLGATRVIDYRTQPIESVTDRFDVVLDIIGNLHPRDARRLLTADGVLLLVTGSLWDLLRARGRVKGGVSPERPVDIAHLLGLVEAGDLRVVIDDVLDLEDIARAHERVDSGHKVGAIVVRP